jgi:hypothetical protein
MIRAKFESMLMDGVFKIAEQVMDDTKNVGKKFKRFWIFVRSYHRHDPMLLFLLETIEKEGAAKVYYEKTHGVDRYWKVKLVWDVPF